jgi:hypothetical protein
MLDFNLTPAWGLSFLLLRRTSAAQKSTYHVGLEANVLHAGILLVQFNPVQ